jgi:hypothetical protein
MNKNDTVLYIVFPRVEVIRAVESECIQQQPVPENWCRLKTALRCHQSPEQHGHSSGPSSLITFLILGKGKIKIETACVNS